MAMRWGRKLLAAGMAALMMFSAAAGEGQTGKTDDQGTATESQREETNADGAGQNAGVTEKDGWHFDEKGFLTGENPGEEYIFEDEENGEWQYASRDLAIHITRFQETVKEKTKKIREYCVAEIWASPASPLTSIATEPKGKKNIPGYIKDTPQKLIEAHPAVFAMSDDYYGHRMYTKDKGTASWPSGIIIRNGEILGTKTRKGTSRSRPCLDTLAVYADGSMKTYVSDTYTAEEYLEQGATQVFAFGPWLISEGKVNEKEAVEGCGYYEQAEPLTGIGMVEPYHYIAIVLRGRPRTKYVGAHLSWLAEKMMEYGCVEALNLDGGGTALMMFNGKAIMTGIKESKLRTQGSLIAFGVR